MSATERATPKTRLSKSTIATYAIGSIGTGGFSTLPGLVLVYYLTDTLKVPALAAGILVTAAKVWDVIIDPVIGGRSDLDLVRHGTRRRFMVLGAVLLPVFFILTFAVPIGLSPVAAGGWVLVAFVLAATAFSLFQVPYIALPAELTDDYDERTRLLTWRVVVLTFAILLFGAGGPMLRTLGGGSTFTGYLVMAVIAGLIIGLGLYVSSSVARKGKIPSNLKQSASVWEAYKEGFAALKRSQAFRALLGTFLLQGLATGLMLAGAQYVAKWVLVDEDAVSYLFIALIAPALIAAPLWGVIANRIGKERAFVLASIIFGLAALSMIGLLWTAGAWVYGPVAIAGAAYAGMQSLPMAMLPDVISDDAAKHKDGQAGTFGGMWTAGETTGMALGATVLTIVLAISGYQASSASEKVTQTAGAIDGIIYSFSIVPAVIILLSLLTLARYRLRKGTIAK
ncbi:MAG: MFS transporter [Microbacteriaceae bacterium]|nr:MFS transporter [Cryobacterium sp.]MBX3104173.1 MFS transporter [Cryobacterium sp.]MCC6376577.1 MFS transporter [Microbacteriaceae bacterium]